MRIQCGQCHFFVVSAGMDYIASSPVTYTLSNPSRMDRIPIRIVNDDVLEMSSETFLVVLTSRDPDVSVQGMSTATVTIEDDDSELQLCHLNNNSGKSE